MHKTDTLRSRWEAVIKAASHPKTHAVSRVVLIVHIVYYVVATLGFSYAMVHTVTSGACAVALVAEYFLSNEG